MGKNMLASKLLLCRLLTKLEIAIALASCICLSSVPEFIAIAIRGDTLRSVEFIENNRMNFFVG